MGHSLRSIVIPALAGLGLLALIGLLGSGLFLVQEAARVHPVLGWAVAALLVAAVLLLVGAPVVQIARLPGALVRPAEASGPRWNRFVRRYGVRLRGNRLLRVGYDGLDDLEAALRDKSEAARPRLEAEITRGLRHLDANAEAVIVRHAAAVFAATAVSQSGKLDTAIVLSAQLRMVKEIAGIYYQRPRPRELWNLYANVGGAAFVAGELQDSELLAVLGAPVTAGVTGMIPMAGASPLISLLVRSLLDGSANALLTLRIGILARRYAGLRLEGDRSAISRSASLEAAGLLGGVVSRGSARVAALTRKLLLERATRGTTRAAKSAVGFGASLFDKILGAAGRAGARAAESTVQGARFLQESLRFWEDVAARSETDAEPPALPAGTETAPPGE